jgi:predicted nucleic acid-binding Zn ribbon protein
MADFTESMTAFTNRLKASIDDRTESLANTHQATTDLLDAARNFMEDVALGHELRADEIQAFLSKSHANRCETVQAMREMHCEELAAMSAEMRRMLDENMKSRTEYVADFMATSHADRCEAAQAMRDNHREELAAMSDELHQMLDDSNKMRLETVGTMRKTFQAAQQALASDLRGAAMTWRQFAASR